MPPSMSASTHSPVRYAARLRLMLCPVCVSSCSRPMRAAGLRHVFKDGAAFSLILSAHGQVPERKNADEFLGAVQDRQPPDLMIGEQLGRFVQIIILKA